MESQSLLDFTFDQDQSTVPVHTHSVTYDVKPENSVLTSLRSILNIDDRKKRQQLLNRISMDELLRYENEVDLLNDPVDKEQLQNALTGVRKRFLSVFKTFHPMSA